MMLVDSHCHLDFPDFENKQDNLVACAISEGVGHMLTICTRVQKLGNCLAIAERFPSVFCSVGTHPHYASEVEERNITTDQIVALTDHHKIVAIGEAGLDFFRGDSQREDQYACFRKHISAARTTGLPLVIHAREADDDMANILREEMQKGVFKAVLHCFSSRRELAELGIELGFYVSFSGILTFKSSGALREIARDLPLDKLLVETDAPYLAPVPHRGKCNEPAYVRHTAQCLAEVRGISYDDIAMVTTKNFFHLFNKALLVTS